MHKEFQFITSILQNNGYPLYFVNKCISTFLNKKFTTKIESTDSNSQLLKEHIFFIKLPYIHTISNQIHKEINSFLKKTVRTAKFVCIEETFNIGRFFTYKDKQETLNRFNVIYEINCNCGKSYIGQTRRNLATRLKDHNPVTSNQHTDVTTHLLENPEHTIDFNNTKILSYANHWRKLLIKESILIQKFEPSLNIDKSSVPLYLFNN